MQQKYLWAGWIGAVLFWASTAASWAAHVHMQGGPFIGVVLSVVIDPMDPGTLYCAVYGGGAFRSSDHGASWVAINRGLPDRQVFSLLILPQNPSQLYLGTDQGIFHSSDKGGSWKPLTPTLKKRNIRAMAVDPKDPNVLYAATDKGVFLGQAMNWKGFSKGLLNKDIRALAVSREGRVYAGTFGGVFKKEKGGDFWYPMNNGLGDLKVRALVIDPLSRDTLYAGTASGGVFKTTNGGKQWRAVNDGLLNTSVLSLAITPTQPPTVFVGTIGGVFKSPNGGAQWTLTGRDLPFTVSTLAFDPVEPNLVYAGSGGRLFKSTNAGEKWEEIASQVNHFGPGPVSARH
ncbi:MAG: WD40/YVTN/BNR-like repeat-containing protein [Candidatus Binatia bacterium]